MRERASSLGVVLLLAIMALAASWLLQNNADMPQVDYAQEYRNLPYIGVLKPEVYTK